MSSITKKRKFSKGSFKGKLKVAILKKDGSSSFEAAKSKLARRIKALANRSDTRWFSQQKFENLIGDGNEHILTLDIPVIPKGDLHLQRHGDRIQLQSYAWRTFCQGTMDVLGTNADPDFWLRETIVFDRTPVYGGGPLFDPVALGFDDIWQSNPVITSSFKEDSVGPGKRFQIVRDRYLKGEVTDIDSKDQHYSSLSTGYHTTTKNLDFVEQNGVSPGDYSTNGCYRYILTYMYAGTGVPTNSIRMNNTINMVWKG